MIAFAAAPGGVGPRLSRTAAKHPRDGAFEWRRSLFGSRIPRHLVRRSDLPEVTRRRPPGLLVGVRCAGHFPSAMHARGPRGGTTTEILHDASCQGDPGAVPATNDARVTLPERKGPHAAAAEPCSGVRTNASTMPPVTKKTASDAIAARWLPVAALTTPNISGPSAADARPTRV